MSKKKGRDLSDIWGLKKRGQRDSDRHKELVREAIKKQGKDLITEYNVITSDGNKKVKVSIKFLDQYRFKYGSNNKGSGTGQGLNGKAGDKYKVRSRKPGDGSAGDEAGGRSFEEEVSVDELVNILLEELKLPWMKPNENFQIEIENEEFSSIEKKGLMPNVDLKKTLIENIKRNAASGNPEVGDFSNEDLRYKVWENEMQYVSNAAIYLMMDRSGSMSIEKKHIAKSFYFWMVQFLKRKYKNIDIIFIAHDVDAFIVNQEEFFTISSGGGTKCSSAFKLAYEHMLANYPSENWNNYVFEFSDGDNFQDDNEICIEYVKKLLPMTRAIGYGEILLDGHRSWVSHDSLLSNQFSKAINRTRFVSLQLNSRDDVFDALKAFFNIKAEEEYDG